jgi:hypothetical protein
VSNVSLAADFSTVLLTGLPPQSSRLSVHTLAYSIDQRLLHSDIRFVPSPNGETKSAHITSAHAGFADAFICSLKELPQYVHLKAEKSHPRLPAWASSKRVSSKKVFVTWYNPTRTVWLNYGSLQLVKLACGNFNNGRYTILDQTVNARQLTGGYAPFNNTSFTVMLQNVPLDAAKTDVTKSIEVHNRPRNVELGKIRNLDDDRTRLACVESLLSQTGPLKFTRLSGFRDKKSKAVAYFQDEDDAREAVDTLQNRPQDFLNGSKVFMQRLSSAKFKVSAKIYGHVKPEIDSCLQVWRRQHVNFHVYQADSLYTLKVEGENTKDLAGAATQMELILAGKRLNNADQSPLWSPSLAFNNLAQRHLRTVERDHNIAIVCHKTMMTLHYFGPDAKFKQVRVSITEKLDQFRESSSLDINQTELMWALRGGLRQIASKFGNDVVSLDLASMPKKIVVIGSDKVYQQVVTIVREKRTALISTIRDTDSTCPICLTAAESPITVRCGHVYCSDCFEGLCLYTNSGDSDFIVVCQGASGTCNRTIQMNDLQESLSSSALETVLGTSFKSFVSRRPTEFKYCSTPGCVYLFRCGGQTKNLTCTNCMEVNCTHCFQRHPSMRCSDYKDLISGRTEAFGRYKREKGIKDCPKCQTPIEKTYGCNHMTCEGCRTHLCWDCLATFRTGQDVYAHMNAEHGGIYDRDMLL